MWLWQAYFLMIVFICCVENKGYIITTGGEKQPNKTLHHEGDNIAKPAFGKGVAKDYADEVNGEDEYDDYDEYAEETPSKKKKRKKNIFKSGVMLGKRLTEAEIIKYLKKEEPVTFQIRNKEELQKCSPFYYCSHKFMDKVCKPDPMFESPCRITLHANGGDRGNQGPGHVIGTCEIDYFGCDPDSINFESEIQEDIDIPSNDTKKDLSKIKEYKKTKEKQKEDENILSTTKKSETTTEKKKDEIVSNNFDKKILDKKMDPESTVKPGKGTANDYQINYDNAYQTIY